MNNSPNFLESCEMLGLNPDELMLSPTLSDNTPDSVRNRIRQLNAATKLSVCMMAWNKQDDFEPDEMANYYEGGVGYTPQFYITDGKLLLSSDSVNTGAAVGIVYAKGFYSDEYIDVPPDANLGLRLSLSSRDRAIDFGKTFLETFNELI